MKQTPQGEYGESDNPYHLTLGGKRILFFLFLSVKKMVC